MSKVVELHGLLNKLTGFLNISYIFADLLRKVFTDIKEEEMASIRFHVALAAAKISKVVIRLLGRNGTHTPGVIALKICPDFLAQAPKAPLTICVTGTNGKTTCSNMITDILEKDGRRVVSNRTGSNIVPGCVTNVINSLTFKGQVNVDVTVFEVDERASRLILPYVKPDYLVVTGLFRDSLKRNANPDYIFSVIDTYCPDTAKVVLNADELCSSMLKKDSYRVFYGIDKQPDDKTEPYNLIADYQICPECGEKLKYNYLRYHHIGDVVCENCGLHSPSKKYLATKIDRENMTLTMKEGSKETVYPLIHTALFNIYNEVTVISALREIGLMPERIKTLMGQIHIPDSRHNETTVNGVTVIQALSKGQSAVSSSRTFEYVANEEGKKAILLAMDDLEDRKKSIEYSGWIYDLEYEQFNRDDVVQVLCTGPRCYDHKVRCLIAGIPEEKIITNLSEVAAADDVTIEGVDRIYILYDCENYGMACEMKKKIIKRLEGGK